MVAAGMLNPVTGMRLVLSRDAALQLPTALAYYRALSAHFHRPLYHPRPMLRLFRHAEQKDRLALRRRQPEYRCWLGRDLSAADMPEPARGEHGGFHQRHAGYLDIPLLLGSLRGWLSESGRLLETEVDSQNDELLKQAKRIILCQGQRARHCFWFGWLPFQVAKGEILTLRSRAHLPGRIINRGKWLLPTRDRHWRLGAGFEWRELNLHTTEKARYELLASLQELVSHPEDFELVAQQAGIRPATRDSQAFLGLHPENPNIGIFNGFGAKGSLMIPWHALRFADFLEGKAPLPAMADIGRFPQDSIG